MGISTAYLTAVTKQYIQFRDTKKRKQRQQREEIKNYIHPELVVLGQEIANARAAGHKIDEIMSAMGLKNKNFLYDALRAYQDEHDLTDDEVIPTLPNAPVPTSTAVEKLNDTQVRASIEGDTQILTVNDRGVIIDMPETWLGNVSATKRSQVKEIIAQVREMF